MSRSNTFCIPAWSAWAAALPTREDWMTWLPEGGALPEVNAKPQCKDAPPMLRRRYSLTTRMAFETAMDACRIADLAPHEPRLFYGSANGEIKTLKGLLESLSDSEPLSPMGFSNTVHHVPTGHYAMVTKHRGLSRTISAFEDTFAMMMLDILSGLHRGPALLSLAEESLPEPFDRMLRPPPFPYGVALIISPVTEGEIPISLRIIREAAQSPVHEEPVFEFLRWLCGSESVLRLQTARGVFEWSR